jgi:peptide/nickel transport system substrate-binding protein
VRCKDIAPTSGNFPWHFVGSEPEEYTEVEQRMIEISNEFCATADYETEYALMSELNKLHTEDVYSLGLATGRYGLMLNKNFKNVPIGTPAFLYQWDANNILPEQVWLAEENRTDQGQTEIYPNAVPFYEGCDYQTSGTPCVVSPAE